MKKLVFSLCMMFGAVGVMNAQDSTYTTSPTDQSAQTTPMEDQGRVKIKSQELPDAVKSSLESQEFRGWLVNSAYKMDGVSGDSGASETSSGAEANNGPETESAENTTDTTTVSGQSDMGSYAQEVYIVELKNGAQTKTVRFDGEGNKLDDAGEMNSDQE